MLVSGGAFFPPSSIHSHFLTAIPPLDDDAVIIVWDLRTGEQIQSISCPFNGAIGAIAWIQLRDTNDPCFVFGCADGSLHLYRHKSESPVRPVFRRWASVPLMTVHRRLASSSFLQSPMQSIKVQSNTYVSMSFIIDWEVWGEVALRFGSLQRHVSFNVSTLRLVSIHSGLVLFCTIVTKVYSFLCSMLRRRKET